MRPPLRALLAFEAAARHLSFKRAADELRVTPSAVSHQIALLEDQIGVPLFDRSRSGVRLTPAGHRYHARIAEPLRRISEATLEVAGASPDLALTIQTPPSISSKWLLPRLSGFTGSHPSIDVRVIATDNGVDFRRCDLALWYGEAPASHVVRPFLHEIVQPLCSPRLLRGDRPLRRPADLAAHTLIHTEGNVLGWEDWLREAGVRGLRTDRGLSLYPSHVAIEAAVKGFGVILESDVLTGDEVGSGELVAPFVGLGLARTSYHLVYPSAHAGRPALRLFEEWMLQAIPVRGLPPADRGPRAGA